jgi:hypothetical protein
MDVKCFSIAIPWASIDLLHMFDLILKLYVFIVVFSNVYSFPFKAGKSSHFIESSTKTFLFLYIAP